jgi:predicted permease
MSVLTIFLLIITGYLLRQIYDRPRLFEILGFLANDLLLTFFVFGSVASKDLSYLLSVRIVLLFVLAVIALNLISSLIYWRLFLRKEADWATALTVLAVFPNTAALGFPLVGLFLSDLTPAVIFSQVNFMLVLPLSIFLINRRHRAGASPAQALGQSLRYPPVVANLLAAALVLIGLRLPEGFTSALISVGWWSLPLMLIYFGTRTSLRHFELRRLAEVAILRMVIPALLIILALSSAERTIFLSVLIEASMPPAIIAGAILARYKLQSEESISVTFVLTILTILVFFGLQLSGKRF